MKQKFKVGDKVLCLLLDGKSWIDGHVSIVDPPIEPYQKYLYSVMVDKGTMLFYDYEMKHSLTSRNYKDYLNGQK